MNSENNHKSHSLIASNSEIKDSKISTVASALLTYFLENDNCNFSQFRKEKLNFQIIFYDFLHELIKSFHCIRIKMTKEISYEFFEDPEICKLRIKELRKSKRHIKTGDL